MRKIGSLLCLSLSLAAVGSVKPTGPSAKTTLFKPSAELSNERAATSPLLEQAYRVFQSGEYLDAEHLYQTDYRQALRSGHQESAGRFLTGIGNCRYAMYRYRDALDAYLKAKKLAEAANDRANLRSLHGNISSLYLLMGDLPAAAGAIEQSLENSDSGDPPSAKSRRLIQLAVIRARQGRMAEAARVIGEAIDTAYQGGDFPAVAEAWDHWGEELLASGALDEADRALSESFRLRKLHGLRKLDSSYLNLGALRLAQGDLRSAECLLETLMARQTHPDSLAALWKMHHTLGEVRMAQGRIPEALGEFRKALDLARDWRLGVLPSDFTRVGSEVSLEKIYSSFIDTGNSLYFSTANRELARETFRAAEENRAASLRALLAFDDWRRALPANYWGTLAQLHGIEARLITTDSAELRRKMRQLRSVILEMEAQAGSNNDAATADLARIVQRTLKSDEVLLSFHLGEPHSYLWAVSREQFTLYSLPSRSELAADAVEFSEAVRAGGTPGLVSGRALYQKLFGQLDRGLGHKAHWILVLDEQLFQVPFGALIAEPEGAGFLAERHALRIATSAAAFAEGRAPPWSETLARGFLGVGDAVYNTADPRFRPRTQPGRGFLPVVLAAGASRDAVGPTLARLAGSAKEVESCARVWGPRLGRVRLLEGLDASPLALENALAAHPSIIHFAAHFLQARQSPQYGMVALSLSPSGDLQFLSPLEITRSRVDAGLVVLSGCSSGRAQALPASGLMGLTRAWLAAGTRAVLASHWPTPDDTGTLFINFYKHLGEAPDAGPEVALQRAQLDMLRAGGWRANPQYWATYFVAGDL